VESQLIVSCLRVAKDAIRVRRRLERRWKQSLDENDRTAY
jgi:hypothetical protein